jgi:hypothetical protein
MRALLTGAVLSIAATGAVQANEPSMSYYYSMLQGVSTQDCLQRSRDAFAANQFQLAESTQNSQFATNGDYLALASCVPAQPTVFFLSIAGPQFPVADAAAQRIRAAVTGQAPQAPPAGTK